jgi:hypothetical protein
MASQNLKVMIADLNDLNFGAVDGLVTAHRANRL